jgi:NAD(P)-dependent dehydrogenase (short-subunit alcohol dehydrogenase family)
MHSWQPDRQPAFRGIDIKSLEGKVAIISGAASGMGAATGRRFAKEGAKVVIADMLKEEGQQVTADIMRASGTAEFMRLDVTSEDDWRTVVEATVQKYGKLDILVNNAGISGSAVSDMLDTDVWDKLMAVNSRGVFLGTKHAALAMKRTGGGSIVNLSSIAGVTGSNRTHMGYNASKGASPHLDEIDCGAIRWRRHSRQFCASWPDATDADIWDHGRPGGSCEGAGRGAAAARGRGR